MHPTDFEGTNIVLTKPQNMTDEQCHPLKAFQGVDEQGFHFILTAWIPNKEDLESLQAGRPLYMKTVGQGFAPVLLFTIDENGEMNI